MPSSIAVHREGASLVVRLRGEIDITLRDQAGSALDQVVTAGLPVVLDLAEVRLVGATGLAFLLQCERACVARGLPWGMRHVPPQVVRVLAALELDAVLRADDDVRTRVPS